ncbi:alpha/beta hydrolase [Streptomyces decoyicus]|uniref:Alpha/beta hydrolase n=1 Tax=Streptomyces decoyicus TaxID=249567 RepID=A0ABZ1FLE2_9ACTN|nr:alpha/beta hydrolase [Streptomyces decoyicus]WSB70787.1 alpha/beta hydrolase [Streptomyces decoyicus]
MNAKHDLKTPLPGARRMAQDFPEGRLAVVDSGGHCTARARRGASRYRRSTPVSLR